MCLYFPVGIDAGDMGNLFVDDSDNNHVRRFNAEEKNAIAENSIQILKNVFRVFNFKY
jgi:hypothetical protein